MDGHAYQAIDRIKSACFAKRDEALILRNLGHIARTEPRLLANLCRIVERGEMDLALDALRSYGGAR